MKSTRRAFLIDGAAAALLLPVGLRFPSVALRSPSAFGVEILPRSAWAGEDAPAGSLDEEDVRFLLVHHTASANDYQLEEVPALLQSFYRFHTGPEREWPDIAYNFLIDRFGRIWEGRSGSRVRAVAGSATGGNQGFTQLVSLIGDFTDTMPTTEALDTLQRTLAWLAHRYNVDVSPGAVTRFISRGSNRWPEGTQVETATIAGHRDMSLTECPGDRLYEYVVHGLAADVARLGASVTAPPTTSSSTTTLATSQTDATGHGGREVPSSPTSAPIATIHTEASAETEGPLGLGGLAAMGAAALAILTGVLALVRRRMILEARAAERPRSSNQPPGSDTPRVCRECGGQNNNQNRYCVTCGSSLRSRNGPS